MLACDSSSLIEGRLRRRSQAERGVASRDCGATAAGRPRDPNGFGLKAGAAGRRGMVRRHCRRHDARSRGRKIATVERRKAPSRLRGTARVSPARLSRFASATRTNPVRLPALRPPLARGSGTTRKAGSLRPRVGVGVKRKARTRTQQRAAGMKKTALFDR
jgi:hypothetical protein